MKLLRNKDTGSVFAWTEKLSKLEHLEEFIPEEIKPSEESEIQIMAKAVLLKRQPKTKTTE
jgi:hypothetical protein